MVSTTLDFLNFMFEFVPLLFLIALFTPLSIVLANSIKKHASVYYWVIGILSVLSIVPMLFYFLGINLGFSLRAVPILGSISKELGSFLYFSHPIMIIIMFIGALSLKNKYVATLMSIRTELSIIVGWPILVHTIKRFFGSFFSYMKYYTDNEAFIEAVNRSPKSGGVPVSEWALFIESLTLGIVGFLLTVLFIMLWITSFRWVRRKMTQKTWKKIQWWAYPFYAMLFIQAFGLQLSDLIRYEHKQEYFATQQQEQASSMSTRDDAQRQGMPENAKNIKKPQLERGSKKMKELQPQTPNQQSAQQKQAKSHKKTPMFSFAKLEVPKNIEAYANMIVLLLVYGSYLFLRVRKALNDKEKRVKRAAT